MKSHGNSVKFQKSIENLFYHTRTVCITLSNFCKPILTKSFPFMLNITHLNFALILLLLLMYEKLNICFSVPCNKFAVGVRYHSKRSFQVDCSSLQYGKVYFEAACILFKKRRLMLTNAYKCLYNSIKK